MFSRCRTALRRTPPEVLSRRVASTGTLVASLEALSQPRRFAQGELLSGKVHDLHPSFARRFPRTARALDSRAVGLGLHAVQAAASAATLVWADRRRVRGVGSAVLALAGAANRARNPFGGDGADQLQQVLNVVHCATSWLHDPDTERRGNGDADAAASREAGSASFARDIAMRVLALETTLSYVASGGVKAVSPVWLKGDAFAGVIRTRNYGDEKVFRLIERYPLVGKAVSWGTIAVELGFPLVYVLPAPLARAYLGSMTLFHLGIGQFMGLNRFVVAFGATHPAVLHVIDERAVRRTARRSASPPLSPADST